jgi:hypothetical protein
MALSRREVAKDAVQQGVEAALSTAGRISAILFDTASRVTSELGSFGTELFEIREASRRATSGDDADHPGGPPGSTHPRTR